MREFHLGNGKIIHMPEKPQREREPAAHEALWCDCHKRMGNDFWFLPTGSCLRDDRRCNGQSH